MGAGGPGKQHDSKPLAPPQPSPCQRRAPGGCPSHAGSMTHTDGRRRDRGTGAFRERGKRARVDPRYWPTSVRAPVAYSLSSQTAQAPSCTTYLVMTATVFWPWSSKVMGPVMDSWFSMFSR